MSKTRRISLELLSLERRRLSESIALSVVVRKHLPLVFDAIDMIKDRAARAELMAALDPMFTSELEDIGLRIEVSIAADTCGAVVP